MRKGDIVAHLVGLPMVAGGLPYADGFRRVGATLCWLGGFPSERILREMRHLRVTTLLATTSFALHLAEQWDEVGRATGMASSLQKVLGGGEPGMGQPELRRRIVDGLGLGHVRDTMGLGDVIPSLWGECEAQDGMHFNGQRYVMVELIDPETGAGAAVARGRERRDRLQRVRSRRDAGRPLPLARPRRGGRDVRAPAAAPARASAASAGPTTC